MDAQPLMKDAARKKMIEVHVHGYTLHQYYTILFILHIEMRLN